MKNNSFISLDCETNGLYGKVYAVAMQVYRNSEAKEKFCMSCKIDDEVDGWLQQNPNLLTVDGSEVAATYDEMMAKAADFYLYHSCRNDVGEVMTAWGNPDQQSTPVLFHCGMIVEGGFFRSLREMGLIGLFSAPICPIDVADILRAKGENPNSVDSYIEKYGLQKAAGQSHNPIFDAEQAATAYLHLIS